MVEGCFCAVASRVSVDYHCIRRRLGRLKKRKSRCRLASRNLDHRLPHGWRRTERLELHVELPEGCRSRTRPRPRMTRRESARRCATVLGALLLASCSLRLKDALLKILLRYPRNLSNLDECVGRLK
jgi:ferric-dicitrate binding protein FerR (iron transport regulator)